MIQSGWYADERGNLGETNRSSMFTVHHHSADAFALLRVA
jgi:hypothetical protein